VRRVSPGRQLRGQWALRATAVNWARSDVIGSGIEWEGCDHCEADQEQSCKQEPASEKHRGEQLVLAVAEEYRRRGFGDFMVRPSLP
jgi:ribosomal protein S18 acetylase RimI-like enzyme